jgi:hypothetical protein
MKSLVTLLAIAAAIAMPNRSLARIGETRAECEKRYGELTPSKFNDYSNVMQFEKDNIRGNLVFESPDADAACVLLHITRADNTPLASEIKTIMKANKGKADWGPGRKSMTPIGPRWDFTTTDGRIHAFVLESYLVGHLTIQSCEWRDRKRNDAKKKEQDSVKGF